LTSLKVIWEDVGLDAPRQIPKSGLLSYFVANRKMTIIIAAVDSAAKFYVRS
jgi:Na+/pantothenate symporter